MEPSLRERLAHRLQRFERRSLPHREREAAAVALALVDDDLGRACVVLTRRPLHLKRHPGQYALPGGRIDSGESAVEAARRELREEVGLDVAPQACLGLLDDYATRSGFVITPVVLWAGPGVTLKPDPQEVYAVYRVPLDDLAADGIVYTDRIPESERPVLSIGIVGTRVFAPTAAMLLQMREVALFGRSTRVAHYEQPPFAWR